MPNLDPFELQGKSATPPRVAPLRTIGIWLEKGKLKASGPIDEVADVYAVAQAAEAAGQDAASGVAG